MNVLDKTRPYMFRRDVDIVNEITTPINIG